MRICTGIYYSTVDSPQTPLPVLTTRLRTEIVDLTATHTLTQIFGNPILAASPSEARPITEANYTFPLYESCAVTSFTAQIGTKLIHGVVKPKAEAKAVYDAAMAAGKEAALLQQSTGEVFTTSVGNIPAGSFVVVVIKYVHELKQDLEVEGVRLVIPTIITPKYGWINPNDNMYQVGWGKKWNVMTKELEEACGGIPQSHGVSMEILATMNGSIRGIQSPSHPISVDIGTHTADSEAFSPHKARATLALNANSLTGLGKDFTLIVNSTEMANPRAFLAPHPTLPDTSTLMVTLVPKFTLPQQRPEIVFIVDRSGSMYDKMDTLKSALHLFLASLPIGTYFNIVSFGQSYGFLWESSQAYSEATFETAKRHVDKMDASMGGTEMYEPIKETVDRRKKELSTEVLVLTDGEIWHTEKLFKYINNAADEGSVRFFSLGVGASVSHVLVEGISRAGKGYSQLVGDGENMQKKVMRMLKAALTPHVNDWSVDWDGKTARLAAFSDGQAAEPGTRPAAVVRPTASLFDESSNPDDPPAATAETFPAVKHPPILQAPSAIPPLFAYTRTTVYYLLSTSSPPATVTLCGSAHDINTNTLQPLSLSIPVTLITSPFTCRSLYSLAGRKLLQDLEESRCSYLSKDPSPALQEAEGTRLGVQFNLASKWTSFVAVSSSGEQSIGNITTLPIAAPVPPMLGGGGGLMMMRGSMAYKSPSAPLQSVMVGALMPTALKSKNMSAYIPQSMESSQESSWGLFGAAPAASMTSGLFGGAPRASRGSFGLPPAASANAAGDQKNLSFFGQARPIHSTPVTISALNQGEEEDEDEGEYDEEGAPPESGDAIVRLSRLQLFSGDFKLSRRLLELLGFSQNQIDLVKEKLGIAQTDKKKETAFATMLVLTYLDTKLKDSEEEWELMADKARAHLKGILQEEEMKNMQTEALRLVDGLV